MTAPVRVPVTLEDRGPEGIVLRGFPCRVVNAELTEADCAEIAANLARCRGARVTVPVVAYFKRASHKSPLPWPREQDEPKVGCVWSAEARRGVLMVDAVLHGRAAEFVRTAEAGSWTLRPHLRRWSEGSEWRPGSRRSTKRVSVAGCGLLALAFGHATYANQAVPWRWKLGAATWTDSAGKTRE